MLRRFISRHNIGLKLFAVVFTTGLLIMLVFEWLDVSHWMPSRLFGLAEVLLLSIATTLAIHFLRVNAIPKERGLSQMYLDVANVMILAVNADQTIRLLNNKGGELLGCDAAIGKNWFDTFIPERSRADMKARFEKMMRGEALQTSYECAVVTQFGHERTIAWYHTVLRDESGKIVGTLASGQDITESRAIQQQLKKSWILFEKTLSSLNEAVFIINEENLEILECNLVSETMFGYSREEMTGTTTKALHVSEEMFLSFRKKIEEQFEKKTSYSGEFRMKRKNGEVFPTEHFVSMIHDDDGAILGHVSVVRDISERKRAEHKNLETLRRQKAILDNIPDMAWLKDKESRYIAVNEKFAKTAGFEPEKLIGKTDMDIWPHELAGKYHADDQAAMISGERMRIEEQLTFKDGRIKWIETIKTPIYSDGGEVIGTTGIGRDITEQRHAEQLLSQAKQDWEETFNTITDMITIHDKDFNIIRANKAAENTLGLPFLQNTRTKCFKYVHGTEAPLQGCATCLVYKTGKQETAEFFEPHLKKHLEIKAIPRINADNELIGMIHVIRDITEHKKLESQLLQAQKMEAVGQLAGGIAHDFNNILTAVLGDAYILEMRMDSRNPLKSYVEEIRTSADKAANLTQSLLAFSRKQVLNPKPMDLNKIVQKLQNLVTRIVGEDIEFKIDLANDVLTVMADSVQIEQVILNLITNARDSMKDGGTLAITTGSMQMDGSFLKRQGYGTAGRYAELTVRDTGEGMDQRTKEKIFEPFFTTKGIGKGTGLGLSIVYGIVKQHNGFIDCHSSAGCGATFNIYLPLMDQQHDEAQPQAIVPVYGKETILLAEDDEKVRHTTKRIIEEFGYSVVEAVDGMDAVHKLKANKDKVQLLLIDVIMPKKNGRETYEEIKKIKPDIKVLFTSGYSNEIINKKGILDENLNFISKPAPPVKLLKKIREVLDAKEPSANADT